MRYLDVYYSRVNHLGETTGERIQNGGVRAFEKWKDQSPFTVRNLSVERGLYFDAIIETHKDKEYQKIMVMRVANDIPILVGDILNWVNENGTIEKWLLIQKIKKVNGSYQTFYIIKCNYQVKWVDADGHKQMQWAYVLSSTDDMIKGNYRTWHSLITPQPNKYAEFIMPDRIVDRATNFIIQDESWTVIDYDRTSVEGIIYISLTEGKVNLLADDLEIDLADTDKLAKYVLDMPAMIQEFKIGESITPVYTLTKDGKPYEAELEYITTDRSIARNVNDILTAVGAGEVEIIARLIDHPEIEQRFTVRVLEDEEEKVEVFDGYIEGNDKIRLDRSCAYTLKGTLPVDGEVTYSIDNEELVYIVSSDNNNCVLHANNKNKLGIVVLSATYKEQTYTKTISIIPLW